MPVVLESIKALTICLKLKAATTYKKPTGNS
jgi:hypothetical protein